MLKGTQLRHARVRARAQLPLRAALAAVPLVATLLLTGTATYAEAAPVSAARTSLADAPATDAALRISAVPGLHIADEPTGQLDSQSARIVMDLIVELVHDRGVAGIVTTHDPALAERADRVITIRDGAIITDR